MSVEIALTDWEYGYISSTGALSTSGADNVACTSGYVAITKGKTYTIIYPTSISSVRFAIYDVDKIFLNRLLNSTEYTAAQDGYLRITATAVTAATPPESNAAFSEVYLTTTGSEDEKKYTLPWLVVQKQNYENAQKFIGKKYLSLGDSIVMNDQSRKGYQHYIVERYNMEHTNHGVSGGTVVSTLKDYLALNFTDVALVTIGFGVNDARTSVPLGAIGQYADTEHDTTTFYGAYRSLLDKIYTENPDCRVILLTPLQRLVVNSFGCDTENTNGNKLVDFADAVIKLGEMYATPVCDMYRESGLNQKNLAQYTTEGVHPEDAGYLRMANLLLDTIDKF